MSLIDKPSLIRRIDDLLATPFPVGQPTEIYAHTAQDLRIVHAGLRILGILTFLAFFGWSVWHLAKMFV